MMKFSIWILITAQLTMFNQIAQAHIGEKLIPFFELTDGDLLQIDLHDGSVEDWLTTIGEPSLTLSDFLSDSRLGEGTFYDPSDLDFRMWLGWHQATSRIYVAAECVDNFYINEYEGRSSATAIYDYDSIQFYIDGDHSGGQFQFFPDDFSNSGEFRLAHYAQAQSYDGIAYTPDKQYVSNPLYGYAKWLVSPPYADGGGGIFGEKPTVSIIEFFVTPFDQFVWNNPDESVVSELFPGKIMGLSMIVGDFDDVPGRLHAVYILPPTNEKFSFFSEFFADGVLVGKSGQIPEISLVEHNTWGRIKESFKSEKDTLYLSSTDRNRLP